MPQLNYEFDGNCAIGFFPNGNQILFDIEDFELISKHKWHIDSTGYPRNGYGVRLHNFLLGKQQKGLVIDHINRNKMDNRRANLRVCTQVKNTQNASLSIANTSGVTGVFFDKKAKRWRAQISLNSKTKHIGIFDCFEDAVNARHQAEQKYYERM